MDLRQLEFFVAVADERHFSRAARKIPIAASVLSKSVRALEQELGTPLLVRTTRRVELTESGEVFLVEARRTLAAADSARRSVGDPREVVRGTLVVGGPSTRPILDQSRILAEYRRRYPRVLLRYVRDTSRRLVEQVSSAAVDVAFLGMPTALPPGSILIEERNEGMCLVCRADHPLADREEVTTDELAGEELIALPLGSTPVGAAERVLRGLGQRAPSSIVVNDFHTALDFVADGLGVSVVIDSYASIRPELRAVRVRDVRMNWRLGLLASAGAQSSAARSFVELVRELHDLPEQDEWDLAAGMIPS